MTATSAGCRCPTATTCRDLPAQVLCVKLLFLSALLPQGLAPLAAVPELERSIVCRGGSINYKHYYVPAAGFETEASCDDGEQQQQVTASHAA
jgi:hypothetical protein